ncbi:MAG: sodium:proton antiporter [Gemmatimonadales bacterium]|nr:sodium:proton antiporter [Gemmatimonadales bacterium]MYJ15367.1 sodium:proton antiporter [Acidimicrobiia bacterium]
MRRVLLYSLLLFAGLVLSQALPALTGDAQDGVANAVRVLAMSGLTFIMIHVGFEFHIDRSQPKQYGWDYLVAFTAASFPWVFVTAYFLFVMLPPEYWTSFDAIRETLLAGRFAAPTSAGVLFSMLAAAGLGATWLFRKARILAIFDDLDTVLLMIPLKMLIVGIAWQLGLIVVFMAVLLALAWVFLHRLAIPVTWPWVLGYAAAIVAVSELLYSGSTVIDPSVPIHIEVLLPAFVLGCLARRRGGDPSPDPAAVERDLHDVLERPGERRAAAWISAAFMLLVGLSMPQVFDGPDAQHPEPAPASLHAAAPASSVDDPTLHGGEEQGRYRDTVTAGQPSMGWGLIVLHVLALSAIGNAGKMFPAFCYRREAHWRHRLAVAVGMWPRGEVGAGVLVLSLSYGIGGPIVTVAMLSLALNLALTGVFIVIVRRLIRGVPEAPASPAASAAPA